MQRKSTDFEDLLTSLGGPDQSGSRANGLGSVRLPVWSSGARSQDTIYRARQAYRTPDASGPDAATLDEAAEEAAVRLELDLEKPRTVRELRQLRRRFARANHPDRLPAGLQPQGRLRMTIANALIDEALRHRA